MILLFIITSILYLILTYLVLSLYYRYRKDIEEVENRLLQIEKRLILPKKEGDIMACKKGRGGRKK